MNLENIVNNINNFRTNVPNSIKRTAVTAALLVSMAASTLAACTMPPSPTPYTPTFPVPTATYTARPEESPTPTIIIPSPTPIPTETFTPTPTYAPSPTSTPTPLPQNVPPVIQIQAPSNAYVSEQIVLDASGTFDYDGDPITFVWKQFHNPDKYTGKEYVTGNDTRIESLDGLVSAIYPNPVTGVSQVRFTPEWPGNYRFELVARDDDGESKKFVDVLVGYEKSPFEVRGVAISPFWITNYNDFFQVPRILDLITNTNSNLVTIAFAQIMPSPDSPEIIPCSEPPSNNEWCITPTDEQLIEWIQMAHDRDLQVMLVPGISVGQYGEVWESNPYYNWDPEFRQQWFNSNSSYILHYAQLAEQTGAEILSLGIDLGSAEHFTIYWENLIAQVRDVYSGKITYIDPTIYPLPYVPKAEFLPNLDYITFAFNFGFEGSRPSNLTHPTIDQMVSSFIDEINFMHLREGIEISGRPVIVYVGMPCFDGAWINPYGFHKESIDNQEQLDFYTAALRVLSQIEGVEGVYAWGVSITPDSYLSDQYVREWDIRGKPILDELSAWYGQ